MRRRDFIPLLGSAMIAAPGVSRAQQTATPVIGFLHQGAPEQNVERLTAFRDSLSNAGFAENRNVTIEYRWARGQNDRLPAMLADLIARQVVVIVTAFSTLAAKQAQAATTTIPIVFVSGTDPVSLGLVASLNRPGGNITGVTSLNTELAPKRLGLLRELVPQASRYFGLVNPTSNLAEPFLKDFQAAAASLGIHCDILHASTDNEIEAAYATIAQQPNGVLVSSTDALYFIRRSQIAALEARHKVPAIFDAREYAEAGCLMSYGANYGDLMQLAGSYTARVLKGEKPADLPVAQSEKFEFVINRKTPDALGLTVPPTLLATADTVIE